MKSLQPTKGSRSNTVLAIANMQNDFCKTGGALYDERSAEAMSAVIRSVVALARQARVGGVPVIHIQSLRTLEEPEFSVYGHTPYVRSGGWGSKIIQELTSEPDDIVVPAWHLDPFYDSTLDDVLEDLVEDPTLHQVIVAGGDIGGFGFLTVLGFYIRNYWTVVPIDAMYGDEECRDFALHGRFSADSQKNIFLSRSDLVEFVSDEHGVTGLIPGA